MILEEFLFQLNRLLEFLESIIRGGNALKTLKTDDGYAVDLEYINDYTHKMLDWLSSERVQDEIIISVIPIATLDDLANIAVKLTTKARNLSTQYSKLKSKVKVIAAWIIFQFRKADSKAYSIIISVLGNTFKDLDDSEHAIRCCKCIINIWSRINEFTGKFSVAILNEYKRIVVEAYTSMSKFYIETNEIQYILESKKSLVSALELSESCSANTLIYTIEMIVKNATLLCDKINFSEECKAMFLIALNAIKMIKINCNKDIKNDLMLPESINRIQNMQLHICLSLAYINMEEGFVFYI